MQHEIVLRPCIIALMRVLLLLLVIGAVALGPFVALRRPWALRMWRRLRLVILVYVAVIFLAAILTLVFRGDEIYGW